MEKIIGDVMRPPICLRTLLSDFQLAVQRDKRPESRYDIMSIINMQSEPDRFDAIEANCSINHLHQFDDVRVMDYTPGFTETFRRPVALVPDGALKMQSFKTLIDEKQKNFKNPFERTRHSFKPVKLPAHEKHSSKLYSDLLIYIRVYRPARAIHQGQRLERPVFAEEFQCLGTNLLTELRDKISCVCNKKRFFDISENPTDDLVDKQTDPGYFFITDTFYNDKRNAQNADYSRTVRDWARTAEGLKHLNFKSAQMEETRFIDLSVSLGFPQLYHHHGNCEHVFVFSQIEFITPSSVVCNPSVYPLLLSLSSYNIRSCNMCGQHAYVFIVEQSTRQLHDPAYLCAKCFYGYHYIDGKKIGSFRAYKVNDFKDEEYMAAVDAEIMNDSMAEEDEEDKISVISYQTHSQTSGGGDGDERMMTAADDPQSSKENKDLGSIVTVKTEKEY